MTTSADPPRFSVLVACYGHEEYVREAIESAWTQSLRPFEIVAVDDGSPDGTGGLLETLAAASPVPMTVVRTSNAGASTAFNLAAARANGEFLSFLNDDDRYSPDRLDAFSRAVLRIPQFGWGFSAVSAIDEKGDAFEPAAIRDSRSVALELSKRPLDALRSFPTLNAAVSSGNLVIRKDLFVSVGGYRPFRHIHDWDLGLRLYRLAEPIILERELYLYRVHGGNSFDSAAAETEVVDMRRHHRALAQSGDLLWNRAAAERAEVAAERDMALLNLQSVLTSRTWRYTAWYRSIRAKLRRT